MSTPEIGQDPLITRTRLRVNVSLRSVWHMLSSIFFPLTCDKFANSAFLRFRWLAQQVKQWWRYTINTCRNSFLWSIKQKHYSVSWSRCVKCHLKHKLAFWPEVSRNNYLCVFDWEKQHSKNWRFKEPEIPIEHLLPIWWFGLKYKILNAK